MSTRTHARKRDRKPRASAPRLTLAYGTPLPAALHDAIEAERDQLSRADSLLGCLTLALEHDQDSDPLPCYPDVARLARDLVRRSIDALDSLSLQRAIDEDRVEEPAYLDISAWAFVARTNASSMTQQ